MRSREAGFISGYKSIRTIRSVKKVLNTVIWANTPASLHILKLKFNVLSDYSDGADEVLLFDGGTVDLGELPLGGSREVRVGARNGSDKPVVVVEAYSSCDCTHVTYDRKPVQPGGTANVDCI